MPRNEKFKLEFIKIKEIIFNELKPKLESNKGLAIFARQKAKFEGWLKVELVEILSNYFYDISPENNRIDITFKDKVNKDWAIELKTINTNMRYENVIGKIRPTTLNIKDAIHDIEKLKLTTYVNKVILFIAFPAENKNQKWQMHLNKIKNKLKQIEYMEFYFSNKIPGVIYLGKI